MRNYNEAELFAFITGLVAETTIGKRAEGEEARTFQMKLGDMPLVSLRRLIEYGAQRFVNDKLGGSDKTLAVKCEMASDIITDLYNGEVSKRREATPSDPMSRFRVESLRELLGKDNWKKINAAENAGEIIAKLLEQHAETIEPRATELKRLDDEKKAGQAKVAKAIDLSQFGL